MDLAQNLWPQRLARDTEVDPVWIHDLLDCTILRARNLRHDQDRSVVKDAVHACQEVDSHAHDRTYRWPHCVL